MYVGADQVVHSAVGQSPQPEVYLSQNAQGSNPRVGIGVGKGGVAQSRQYKKSVNSKTTGSGIVSFTAS